MHIQRHRTVTLLLLSLLLIGCKSSSSQFAHQGDPALAQRLETLLSSHGKPDVRFTARVVDLSTGKELYAHDIDAPFIPASNGKLFTSTTGLHHFGPDHKFKTYLAMDGDDLWIIGTGDPAVGDEPLAKSHDRKMTSVFDDWAAALKAKGVTSIKGKLIYYQNALDREWICPSWSRDYLTDWYAAPVTGLTFNDNCVDITVIPTDPGKPARYEVMPPVKNIKVINKTTSASKASTKPSEAPDIDRERDSNTYILKGVVHEKKTLASKPVIDPGAFFADALRTNFESNGIKIAGPAVESPTQLGGIQGGLEPPKDKLIATHETPMADVLWRINKSSQNLFAEALSKLNGQDYQREHGKGWTPGSWHAGSDAAHAFLKSKNIRDTEIVLVDGSGLARKNRVTSHTITDLLAAMHAGRHFDAFYASLSIAGKDGTISKRMKDLGERIHAKTGYIGGVRSLSGYATTYDNKILAFSIIFNGFSGSTKPYENLQDEACRILVNWPHIDRVPPSTQPMTQPTTTVAAN